MNENNRTQISVGIPYDDINWREMEGQPFGTASHFNAFILNDANNIVDLEGAFAIGGSFYSPRGLGVAYRGEEGFNKIPITPNQARFIIGRNMVTKGPLVVSGHVVGGEGFQVAKGSSYFIGKDRTQTLGRRLAQLYHQNGGSPYWKPVDKGMYYLISSYDVPRYIPNERIDANLTKFFQDARTSLQRQKNILERMPSNGLVETKSNEWVLRGNHPVYNVFRIDAGPIGLINKQIRIMIPSGSLAIIRFKTGPNAHLQYGVMGDKRLVNHTLYVFEDATNIYMEKSADIWGSILAPQAMFHAHPTGGHVSGNAVFRDFAVNPNSGFEFHWHPFIGGLMLERRPVMPEQPAPMIQPIAEIPQPLVEPITEVIPAPAPTIPEPEPCPPCPSCPEPVPCPPCPEAVLCPTCPEPEPCPPCPRCPDCPEPKACPEPEPCPPCPSCPEPEPCPKCPPCPKQEPCEKCPPCPECPKCPEQQACPIYREYVIDKKIVLYPVGQKCPDCEKCQVVSGKIMGCIWGCHCGKNHGWEVKLYKSYNCNKTLLYCTKIDSRGCFEFEVPYEGCYLLSVCPIRNNDICRICRSCKPFISLRNIGVSSFMID